MKRTIVRVLPFLLIGAALNIAVAWICARFSPLRDLGNTRYLDGFPREWQQSEESPVFQGVGRRRTLAIWPVCDGLLGAVVRPFPGAHDDPGMSGNKYARALRQSAGRERWHASLPNWYMDIMGTEDRCGLPFEALRTRSLLPLTTPARDFSRDPVLASAVHDIGWLGPGIEIGGESLLDPTAPMPLPLQPIWPGFALNTAFYAVLAALVLLAWKLVRGFLRLRRCLCPHCAYPIGISSICSECGKAIGRRVASLFP